MALPRFKYFEPENIEEACSLLSQYGRSAKVLAAGTDLLQRVIQKAVRYEYLINIKTIPNLNFIKHGPQNELRIGPLATLNDIEGSEVIKREFPTLAQAAHSIGTPQLRNIATIGGNLCQDAKCLYFQHSKYWRKSIHCFRVGGDRCYIIKGAKTCNALSLSDIAPALLALPEVEAKIINPDGVRSIKLEGFFQSPCKTMLAHNDILAEIIIPKLLNNNVAIFLKYQTRKVGDFGIVIVAVYLAWNEDNRTVKELRIAINAVAPTPLRLREAGEIAKGKELEKGIIKSISEVASKEIRCFSDSFFSASYRREMVKVFVKRALMQALEKKKVNKL